MQFWQYYENPEFGKVICGLKNDDYSGVYEIDDLGPDTSMDDFWPMHISFHPVDKNTEVILECTYCPDSFTFSQNYVRAICGKLPNWKPEMINIYPDHIVFSCYEFTEDGRFDPPGGTVQLSNPESVQVRIELDEGDAKSKVYLIHMEDGKMLVDEYINEVLSQTSEITEEYELITEA